MAKALKAQLTTAEQWRELAVLTGAEQSDYFRNGGVFRELDFGGDQLDAAVHEAVPVLLGFRELWEFDGECHLDDLSNVRVLEDRLNLPIWLAHNDPDLYRHLYPAIAGDQSNLTLDELLAAMDRTAANLERLQAIWERAAPMLPSGPAVGSSTEYEDLARAWNDLLPGLPRIDGWTITASLPAMDGIGQAYLDYLEIGEPPVGVQDAAERPGRDLADYRHRLSRARRRAVRDRMQELTTLVDSLLPQLLAAVPRRMSRSSWNLGGGPTPESYRVVGLG